MPRKILFSCLFLGITISSCKMLHKLKCNKKITCLKHSVPEEKIELRISGFYNNSPKNYKYIDFPGEDLDLSNVDYEEEFAEGGHRLGRIRSGYKEGKWLSGDVSFDSLHNVIKNTGIWREEYFKNGLRDSIFRQLDGNGKIIYETTFKKGNGLWKEFHGNGALYFEMYTKNGYFADTLRLYDDEGRIVGKRLYLKDSLVYDEGLPCFPYRLENLPSN